MEKPNRMFIMQVSFNRTRIEGKILGNVVSQEELDSGKVVNVQCFPLYSIMMAQGRTKVDYFSLDVEGNELDVLRTIPWHKVDITVGLFFSLKLKSNQV